MIVQGKLGEYNCRFVKVSDLGTSYVRLECWLQRWATLGPNWLGLKIDLGSVRIPQNYLTTKQVAQNMSKEVYIVHCQRLIEEYEKDMEWTGGDPPSCNEGTNQ